MSTKTDEACEVGLRNSLYTILAIDDEEVIGMGMVIGDGGCFCQVVDICVILDRQGKGVGKLIMEDIITYFKTQMPMSYYTSLFADGEPSFLYEKYGFKAVMPASKGMYMKNT